MHCISIWYCIGFFTHCALSRSIMSWYKRQWSMRQAMRKPIRFVINLTDNVAIPKGYNGYTDQLLPCVENAHVIWWYVLIYWPDLHGVIVIHVMEICTRKWLYVAICRNLRRLFKQRRIYYTLYNSTKICNNCNYFLSESIRYLVRSVWTCTRNLNWNGGEATAWHWSVSGKTGDNGKQRYHTSSNQQLKKVYIDNLLLFPGPMRETMDAKS